MPGAEARPGAQDTLWVVTTTTLPLCPTLCRVLDPAAVILGQEPDSSPAGHVK